jgi:isopentenyldiphosphate isomerase/intracellular septation protein A
MINKTIFKSFSAGFIPLFIFIIVDMFYGTEIGLIAAMTIGLGEFIYYYIRYRKVEKFVLFDIVLILFLGVISLLLQDAIFFKLKPALIELILAILLGVHAFSDTPLLMRLGQRYLKGIQFSAVQQTMLKKLTGLLFWIVLIHTGLIIYAAFYLSDEAWAFISGGLFYIIFGLIFLGQIIYQKMRSGPAVPAIIPGEEQFDLVTPEGNIIGKASRSAVHGNPDLLHPVIHVHVFNRNGQLYLQKRSQNKDVQPGKWDTAIGGHVNSGERIEEAVKREASEELGMKNIKVTPLFRYVMKNEFESELIHAFRVNHNGPFRINRNEIEYGRFWKISEIEANLNKGIFTPNFEQEFMLLKKNVLSHKTRKR